MEDVKPLSPEEVGLEKKTKISSSPMIETFNKLLVKNFRVGGTSVTLLQKDIINAFLQENPSYTRERIFEEHILDFEEIFRDAGWKVYYDRPAYYETYEPSFEFTAKK